MTDRPDSGLWAIELTVPLTALAAFEDALSPWAVATAEFELHPASNPLSPAELWRLQVLTAAPPDRRAITDLARATAAALDIPLPVLIVHRLPDADWVARTNRLLAPVRAGRLFVHGTHHRGTRPPGAVSLCIDAGPAAGTGRHEPTRGCLLALDRLARRQAVRRVLDIGTGSGILAIAAARLWHAPVTAVDLDPTAVRVAQANAARNGVRSLVRVVEADGVRTARVRRDAPYDLVVANLLSGPLCVMAADVRRVLAPGGIAVLAGLLGAQQAEVLAAYRGRGFHLVRRIVLGAWTTLVLRRGPSVNRRAAR